MRVLISASLLLISAASPAAAPVKAPAQLPVEPPAQAIPGQTASADARCQDFRVRTIRETAPPKASRLGELPDGKLVLSVWQEIGGCVEPVIVRQGIGSLGRR
ncbi:MAG TPA: hypothetical protein VF727_11270 [Allosphingosinicella sp.]